MDSKSNTNYSLDDNDNIYKGCIAGLKSDTSGGTISDRHLNIYAKHGSVIKDIITSEHQENAFFINDINVIVERAIMWKDAMPRVAPHYAVKCNDHIMVLKVLAVLGFGFDCASMGEINKVLSLGVDPSRIVFASTIKLFGHIRHAAKMNVDLVTFDNETELYKLRHLFPKVRVLIRIRYDATAMNSLGPKFGCNPETEAPMLLQKAQLLGINVVGVSFHVGSGCYRPSDFYNAIKAAKGVSDIASSLGYNFNILDIGGGFTTRHGNSIYQYAKYINSAIEDFFPDETFRVISEPGTYFVEGAFTLACNIHSMKSINSSDDGNTQKMYYLNDGTYGSFNIRHLDKDILIPQPLKKYPHSKIYPTVLWGPTMDSIDKIASDILLPEMEIGDWLVFVNMGDYSLTACTSFNSMESPEIYNIISRKNWKLLSNTPLFKSDDFIGKPGTVYLLSKKEKYHDHKMIRG